MRGDPAIGITRFTGITCFTGITRFTGVAQNTTTLNEFARNGRLRNDVRISEPTLFNELAGIELLGDVAATPLASSRSHARGSWRRRRGQFVAPHRSQLPERREITMSTCIP